MDGAECSACGHLNGERDGRKDGYFGYCPASDDDSMRNRADGADAVGLSKGIDESGSGKRQADAGAAADVLHVWHGGIHI